MSGVLEKTKIKDVLLETRLNFLLHLLYIGLFKVRQNETPVSSIQGYFFQCAVAMSNSMPTNPYFTPEPVVYLTGLKVKPKRISLLIGPGSWSYWSYSRSLRSLHFNISVTEKGEIFL